MLQCIIDELVMRKHETNEMVETIYFGGGTPSLLTRDELQLLIDTVFKNYSVSNDAEITLEANPDDLKKDKIIQLSKSQINRLSIGIQSFFNDDLQTMNRAHTEDEAKSCLEKATKHFDNITVDLIYGIPNMSLERWDVNLQTTFDFGVNHISSYALTVEPKTALASFIEKGTFPPIDENLALQHFSHLIDETQKHDFVQYEISNFGKPGYFSKHNTSYWQGKFYLGIGPSAHSFNGESRSWNVANNIRYIKAIQKKELPKTLEILSINDKFNEYVMTSLRTIWGISLCKVETDFGKTYKKYLLEQSQKYLSKELLYLENDKLMISKKGKFLADGIASHLFMI